MSRNTPGSDLQVKVVAVPTMGAPDSAAASDIQLLTKTYFQYAADRQLSGLMWDRLVPLRLDREDMAKIFTAIDNLVDNRRERLWQMCEEMNLTLANVYGAFNGVVVSVFRDGTTWGRIITAVAYTYVLSQYCRSVGGGLEEVAEALPERLSAVLSQPALSTWIRANGSVDGLRDYAHAYDNNLQRLEETQPPAAFKAVTGLLAKGLNFSIKIALGSNEVFS